MQSAERRGTDWQDVPSNARRFGDVKGGRVVRVGYEGHRRPEYSEPL